MSLQIEYKMAEFFCCECSVLLPLLSLVLGGVALDYSESRHHELYIVVEILS